jgi:hypothetical protein
MSAAAMSCQEEKKALTDYFSQEQEYSVKVMDTYPVDSIGLPQDILSTGDYVILAEPMFDKVISLYDMMTHKFVRFLTRGQGPDELTYIYQIGIYNDSSFFVRDGQKLFVYSFDGDFSHPSQKFKLPENTGMSSYYDQSICIYNQQLGKRFALYDAKNQSHHEFGETITLENCPPEELASRLQLSFTGNSKVKKIACTSIFYDIFEIYDYSDTSNIKTVKQYVGDLPPILLRDVMTIPSPDNKISVVSITSGDKYIYALYNGTTIKKMEEMAKSSPSGEEAIDNIYNKILVYDWDGNPVKIIKVDKKLKYISFNEKQQTLYCLGRGDAEYEVYAIPVKDLE